MLKYEVLICHFGQKQSTLMSAISFPPQLNLEFSSICA